MDLNGKRVAVIGGGSGIGRAVAAAAAAAGAEVIVAGRTEARLQAVKKEVAGSVTTCVLDLRHERAVDECLATWRPLDHLVVTAAEIHPAPFVQTDVDDAKAMFETKFWGSFTAVQYGATHLREGGSVTLFSGLAAHRPVVGLSVVAAMNGAIEALTRSLAVELAPLRVNAVCPGYVETNGLTDEQRDALGGRLPVGRIGRPEDIAAAVLTLMTNPYTTGTILHIDGGGRLV